MQNQQRPQKVRYPFHRWKILTGSPAQVEKLVNEIFDAGHPDVWLSEWKISADAKSIVLFVRVGISETAHYEMLKSFKAKKDSK